MDLRCHVVRKAKLQSKNLLRQVFRNNIALKKNEKPATSMRCPGLQDSRGGYIYQWRVPQHPTSSELGSYPGLRSRPSRLRRNQSLLPRQQIKKVGNHLLRMVPRFIWSRITSVVDRLGKIERISRAALLQTVIGVSHQNLLLGNSKQLLKL